MLPEILAREPVVQGKWLNLFNLTYTTHEGETKRHPQFERPIKAGQERLSSGADIIALGLGTDGRVKIVLEIIYRVPVEKYLI